MRIGALPKYPAAAEHRSGNDQYCKPCESGHEAILPRGYRSRNEGVSLQHQHAVQASGTYPVAGTVTALLFAEITQTTNTHRTNKTAAHHRRVPARDRSAITETSRTPTRFRTWSCRHREAAPMVITPAPSRANVNGRRLAYSLAPRGGMPAVADLLARNFAHDRVRSPFERYEILPAGSP